MYSVDIQERSIGISAYRLEADELLTLARKMRWTGAQGEASPHTAESPSRPPSGVLENLPLDTD